MAGTRVLPKDSNNVPVHVARGFVTTDNSGTPKTSPLSVTTTEVSIVVPSNAVELIIVNTSQALRVSETSGGTATSYFLIAAGSGEVIQMGEGGTLYIRADSITSTVQFYFRTI